MRWAGHVARVEIWEMQGTVVVGKLERNRTLGEGGRIILKRVVKK
jgi:hypothetical protein